MQLHPGVHQHLRGVLNHGPIHNEGTGMEEEKITSIPLTNAAMTHLPSNKRRVLTYQAQPIFSAYICHHRYVIVKMSLFFCQYFQNFHSYPQFIELKRKEKQNQLQSLSLTKRTHTREIKSSSMAKPPPALPQRLPPLLQSPSPEPPLPQ